MEPIYVFDPPVKPSGSMLLGESIVDTLLGLLIGMVLTIIIVIPIVAINFRAIERAIDPPWYTQSYQCSALPATDDALRHWAATQKGIDSATVTREGAFVTIEYRTTVGDGSGPAAPAAALGYKVLRSDTERHHRGFGSSNFLEELATNPFMAGILVASLIASEAGFLLACAWCVRRTRDAGERIPAFFDGPIPKSILFGIGMGGVALAIGQAWSMVLARAFGPSVNTDGALAMVREFPLWGKISIAILGTVAAPLGEEFFFRGFLFGRYAAAGRVNLGIFVSSLFFAAAHLDPVNFVGLFAMGAIMAWTYHRSGTLIASMTTHAVNNAVAFAVLFSTHHA